MSISKPTVCLAIAGLDPSGGAGTIADVKTFSAFGCFATAAVTSLTFQNTVKVFGAVHQTADTVRQQVEPILHDFDVEAVKTGMLPTVEIINEVANLFHEHGLKNIVVDPVVRSTSGYDLIDNMALQALIRQLFPIADLVTPNIPEAERITGIAIQDEDDIAAAARQMQSMGVRNVLIKGGHLSILDLRLRIADLKTAKDYLFLGDELHIFEAEYIETISTHGTGCTLSSAIAANLALGNDLRKSIDIAKKFVTEAIRTAPGIGHGHSPLNIQPIVPE